MFPIVDKTAASQQHEQFYCSELIFLCLFTKTAGHNLCVRDCHNIIHPSGVFDRLYPNEHSPAQPRDPHFALTILFFSTLTPLALSHAQEPTVLNY